jgi:pyrroline-5-carboxylate reductase
MALTLALVGCGAIGSALLEGWLTQRGTDRFSSFSVITPHKEHVDPFLHDTRVAWFSKPEDMTESPDCILFALKPYQMEDALPSYTHYDSLILTVASGKTLSFYENYFPYQGLIRAMPNTPIRIHQGVIGLLANQKVNDDQKKLAELCFNGLGYCTWLSSDEDIDKITAVTGSGPAYVFYMIEALTKAALSLGFDKETSTSLALHTFCGASLYALESKTPPEALRAQVTSPKGTTAAALEILTNQGIIQTMEEAVKAAFNRARELGK